MSSAIHAKLLTNRRTVNRTVAERASTVRQDDGIPVDMIIDDLSYGGCRMSGDIGLYAGDRITIGLPGIGVRSAQVVWAKDGSTGLTFDVPLSREDIMVTRQVDTLIDGRFTITDSRAETADEDEILSPRRRLGIIVAAAVCTWCVAIIAIKALIRLI